MVKIVATGKGLMMEHLWAPWRMEYIKIAKEEGCILCQKPLENSDAANYILHRGRHNFVIMNSYPYNTGHLMIAPSRHVANLEELTDEELGEHYRLIRQSITVLKQVLEPEGFNIGMNLGRIAGAGVDKHIQTHIVPRWAGDTNFMPVIADTDVVNEALEETYKRLVDRF
jgi:ATP adenylyltransferase